MSARAVILRGLSAVLLVSAASVFAQTAALPLLSPPAVREGVAASVTVRSLVSAANLIPGSVNVQLVAANGTAIVLGQLNDSGNAGDLVAGDNIHSGTVVVPASVEGALGLRVSFATRGSLKRTFSPLAALAVLPVSAPVAAAPVVLANAVVEPVSGARILAGRLLACFTPATSYASVLAIAGAISATPVGALPDAGNCFQFRLAGSAASDVTSAAALLAARSEVRFAEPEFISSKQSSCSPASNLCSDVKFTTVLGLGAAHSLGEGLDKNGNPVLVGIVDTGLDASMLGGSALFPGLVVGSNFITPGTPPADDEATSHGTLVAGVVQATAPLSRLMIAKVLDANGQGTEAQIWGGLREMALAGAKVINMSLGDFNQSFFMLSALNTLQSAGIHIVAAAGNNGTNRRVYPAAHVGVIAVGNTDDTDKIWTGTFPSSFGPWVNVAAPGVALLGVQAQTGTSLSAPWVTGTVALMLGKYGTMTIDDARKQLFRTALPIAANAGQDQCPNQPCNQDLGSGRIDPAAALGAVRLTRVTAVGASGAVIQRTIDVSIRRVAGTTVTQLFATTMSFLGQSTGCQVKTVRTPPCIATIPFDFAALGPGNYQLRLSFSDPSASFFGQAQVTAPSARFTGVSLGTGAVNPGDPSRADFSLFGAGQRTTILEITR